MSLYLFLYLQVDAFYFAKTCHPQGIAYLCQIMKGVAKIRRKLCVRDVPLWKIFYVFTRILYFRLTATIVTSDETHYVNLFQLVGNKVKSPSLWACRKYLSLVTRSWVCDLGHYPCPSSIPLSYSLLYIFCFHASIMDNFLQLTCIGKLSLIIEMQ